MSLQEGDKQRQLEATIAALSVVTGIEYTEEERRSLRDAVRWADIVPQQAVQWIRNSAELAAVVASGRRSKSDIAWFWISLFAILHELLPYFQKHAEYFGGPATRVRDRIVALKECLSENELLYVDYQRQEMVHPFVKALRMKVKRPRRGTKPARFDGTYRGRPIEDVEAAVRQVMESVATSTGTPVWDADERVAKRIATRCLHALRELLREASAWQSA